MFKYRMYKKIDYKNLSDEEQQQLYLRIKREEFFEENNVLARGEEQFIKIVGILFVAIITLAIVGAYVYFVNG